MLNERRARGMAPQQVTIHQTAPQTTIAASPKVRAMLEERKQAVEIAPLK